MLITKLHTPEGIKDYLPGECEFKTEIENKIADTFYRCGFRPISTPTIEYAEVFENTGGMDSKRLYKFVDRDGTLLSLRPDVTPSIARIVATADIPGKLYYIGSTFRRNESYQGKLREFTQAGIEIIGSHNSFDADVEALTIAIRALKSVGIDKFKIDIGHAMFLAGVIEEADISECVEQEIKESILNKNYVAVSDIADKISNKNIASILKDLPLLIGNFDIIEAAEKRVTNEKSISALNYLKEIYYVLKALNLDEYISFDLSVIGAMDYYTGIIFRGYTKGTGFSVLDGGRYDNMVKGFGKNMPAVGFAIKINDIINVAKVERLLPPDMLIAYKKEYMANAFKYAEKMRNSGLIAEISDLGDDYSENLEYARDRKVKILCYFEGEEPDITNISDN